MRNARIVLRTLLSIAMFMTVGNTATWLIAASEDKPRHPLHAALEEAKEAKRELEKAPHNFGGHRDEALRSTEHAIKHLERLVGWVHENRREEWKQEWRDEKRVEIKGEKYPRFHAAAHELRKAYRYVEESKHEFGDNKQKEEALRSLRNAAEQIEKSLKYGDPR